ncbi:MAG TPA: MBL fold metallo-hydrolase [Xanthobacteraceae bacterium]|nr:MBL fold metallo-hydrolase [Xanthobacteraceae bacterium]
MRLQFIGSGDAFGSGGRSNTCFHITGERTNLLIDCGASSLPSMKRLGIDRNAVDTILVTHFHGDHFGGVPFFILDAQFIAKRTRPLLIAGPPGVHGWFERAMGVAFPGERQLPFPLTFREVDIGRQNDIGNLRVTPFHVRHDDRAGPCLAYRIEAEGKTITYSGDTEWVDALNDAARGADLFISECYMYDKPVRAHLSLKILEQHLPDIGAKRVILTHMSEDMLARLADIAQETAEDGMIVEF